MSDLTAAQVAAGLSRSVKRELIAIAQNEDLRKVAGHKNGTYEFMRIAGLVAAVSGNVRITHTLTRLGADVVTVITDGDGARQPFRGKVFPNATDSERARQNVETAGELPDGDPAPDIYERWRERSTLEAEKSQFVKDVAALIAKYDFPDAVDVHRLLQDAYAKHAQQVRTDAWDNYRQRLERWKAEHNALSPGEYADKYELSRGEMKHAERILPQVDKRTKPAAPASAIGGGSLYETWLLDEPPSDEHRAKIRQQTTVSKRQACERLDVSGYMFDKLKKQLNIRHVKTVRTSSGHAAYLYSLADIDRMRDALEDGD